MIDTNKNCPCGSNNTYSKCCKKFHEGKPADTALKLMRSRYSAYALNIPDYIIQTTHLKNPEYTQDKKKWAEKISHFSLNTQFKNLEILDFEQKGSFATVTFFAQLTQMGKDVSFTEKSYFEKVDGNWLYLSGILINNHSTIPKII